MAYDFGTAGVHGQRRAVPRLAWTGEQRNHAIPHPPRDLTDAETLVRGAATVSAEVVTNE